MCFLMEAAHEQMDNGSSIINMTSVTIYKGSSALLVYSSAKGAIHGLRAVPEREPYLQGWREHQVFSIVSSVTRMAHQMPPSDTRHWVADTLGASAVRSERRTR